MLMDKCNPHSPQILPGEILNIFKCFQKLLLQKKINVIKPQKLHTDMSYSAKKHQTKLPFLVLWKIFSPL